jgi:hypothetical protein
MRLIGDSMLKIEVGQTLLRGKGGNMPFVAFPVEPSTEVTSGVDEGMRQLDEVDWSHLREAGKHVLEMIQGLRRRRKRSWKAAKNGIFFTASITGRIKTPRRR